MERVPHVSFKGKLRPDSEFEYPPGASLGRALEAHLRQRFDSVSAMENWRDSGWVVNLSVNDKQVEVYFAQSNPEDLTWLLAVAPLKQPNLLARAFGRKAPDFGAELQSICAEVHGLLTSTPSVSEVKWFLGDPPSAGAPVSTPEQLSWV